jgi:glucose/arabinose dehydrogenase
VFGGHRRIGQVATVETTLGTTLGNRRENLRKKRHSGFLPAFLAATAAVLACDESEPVAPVDDDGVVVALELVADGLEQPLYLASPPGDPDRLFVVEREGTIRIVRDGAVVSTPFLDISDDVTTEGEEQGLLGLAFHPAYGANGYVYVNYTDRQGRTRIVRFTATGDVANPASDFTVLTIPQPAPNHNGGMLAFGPDGMLYIGAGDGGDGQGDNAQDRGSLHGSLLRIDVDGGTPYAVPTDNPFVGEAGARAEIWAKGFRNPWRFSFDRATDDLYIADVGEAVKEEIDFQLAISDGGENYGWDVMEGTACYEPPSGCSTSGFVRPIYEYDHSEGCSITGGYVYRGSSHPDLVGRYFFSDFCASWLRSFTIVGGIATDVRDHADAAAPLAGVASFGEDANGELYVLSMFSGTVHRIVAR